MSQLEDDVPTASVARAVDGRLGVGELASRRVRQRRGQAVRPNVVEPTGPVLVTADELTDPHNLRIQLRLNGTTLQNSSTKEFIFGVPHLLWFLSQVVTLEPGDLIFTGTPPGVGIARKPDPVLLKPGDVVEVEIEKIGVLKNPCVAE